MSNSGKLDYEVKIVLSEVDHPDTKLTFPILPEEINVECGTRFQSYDIMNIGEIKVPLGEQLTCFSWNGIFPGQQRQMSLVNKPRSYIKVFHDPHKIQTWLSFCRVEGRKLYLDIKNTPVKHQVYLESYSVRYSGGYGDYNYSIKLVHAKELKISTDENLGTQPSEEKRPSKEKQTSYAVKSGDSLWEISKQIFGDGTRYNEIAKLNNISNPSRINPGQVLILPDKE